ncbi:MAG: hypothetical protein C0514_05985 [Candidatus Puniceispirillum sp.]|nr:hypothetical protein [Candidatus Puniceispirillum sp.]
MKIWQHTVLSFLFLGKKKKWTCPSYAQKNCQPLRPPKTQKYFSRKVGLPLFTLKNIIKSIPYKDGQKMIIF